MNLDNNINKERFGEREQVSSPVLNSKLTSKALVFVPKSMIAKKNESKTLASSPTNAYTIDLGDFL